ncbi:MAG: hypothetical protein J2P58_07950 [Acidimicrobiaceae bacterium]|nr:hypothetical protein [Acidimicrobiaceae bacterium]MBO0748325.1 hypothetical protein [Acidimicrobiaceae bacterium]
MIEPERPEHPARVRQNARLGIGATAALAAIAIGGTVIAAGGTVLVTAGSAMAAGSSPKAPASGNAQRPAAAPFWVTGVLKSVGKKSLAFKLANGTVATATLSSSTVYRKTENLKPSALSNGKRVTVTGKTTSGVLAASRVVVTPAFRAGSGGFGPRAGVTRPSLPAGSRPRPNAGPGGPAPRPRAGFGAGGNFAFGTISGLSGGSFTLTEPNNAKVKVTTSASTVVTETVRTTKTGLKLGQELLITGREVNNTTVAAATVSQGVTGFGPFGRPGRGPGGVRQARAEQQVSTIRRVTT